MTTLWTRTEASRALPYVRAIVADLRDAFLRLRKSGRRLSLTDDGAQREALKGEVSRLSRQCESLVHELDDFGVVVRDLTTGETDFPVAVLNTDGDGLVWLTWWPDHERISFYREHPEDEPLPL